MAFTVTRNDLRLAARKLSFASPEALPLSFTLGGRRLRGVPAEFSPVVSHELVDAGLTLTRIVGQNADGLELRAEILTHRDFPVAEYTVWFTNRGQAPSELLTGIDALDAVFCGADPVLVHGSGDDCTENSYRWSRDPVAAPIVLAPKDDGTSCSGAYPFFRVLFRDQILTAAVGWSGTWKAEIAPSELGVSLRAGQKYCAFRILPGETMRTPRMVLMLSDTGDETRAINLWRAFFRARVMPRQNGRPIPPKLCLHVFGYHGAEFTGSTEDCHLEGFRRFVERGVKPDLWWFDAGFYPCPDGEWYTNVGTWVEDPVRFPNGLAPVGELCAANGADFMVWFEPERVRPGTELDVEHPEFLLRAVDENGEEESNRLLNLGDPAALAWITDRVDALIKKARITCYRQDFNFPPFRYWRQNEGPDRLGALENLHVQGYYAFWDELVRRNPGLFLDSCASGGRRNDYETLRRAVPFQYTDVGCGDHRLKQLQHQQLFQWAPYFRAHTMSWDAEDRSVVDEMGFFNAFAPACTFTANPWDSEESFARARTMLPFWRKAAELELNGDFYPQMESTGSWEDFFCIHFHEPVKNEGFALFIRNKECPDESFTARLALDPDEEYVLENPLSGEKKTGTGRDLALLTVSLEKRAGCVWFYHRLVRA
ncbi:MAG: alpha-galactosidase [Oscillospiraceae bacterium]|nr:alpha-galactosidase [Oscillospiraceae bacterium]